jgi:thiol-disulfide isomerase/thioredoxin
VDQVRTQGGGPGSTPSGRYLADRRGWRALPALIAAVGIWLAACSTAVTSTDAAAGFVQQAPGQYFAAPGQRRPAPALTGTTLTGASFSLTSQRGRIVVVTFRGSWCPPCRAEARDLAQLSTRNPEFAFVGVDEHEEISPARAFTADHGLTYPNVYDQLGMLAARWPAVLPPTTFLIDPNGDVAARLSGGVTVDSLDALLTRLQAETTSPPASSDTSKPNRTPPPA